mmetsp:Transcript_127489/g.366744  ORF Transcript_127489/g.366744 Transcript_127489/m.366744 type:complete len:222 (-) Transcript_127489:196-861(-)
MRGAAGRRRAPGWPRGSWLSDPRELDLQDDPSALGDRCDPMQQLFAAEHGRVALLQVDLPVPLLSLGSPETIPAAHELVRVGEQGHEGHGRLVVHMRLDEARLPHLGDVIHDVLDLRIHSLFFPRLLEQPLPFLDIGPRHELVQAGVQAGVKDPQLRLESPDPVLKGQVALPVIDLGDAGVVGGRVDRLDVLPTQKPSGQREVAVALGPGEPFERRQRLRR